LAELRETRGEIVVDGHRLETLSYAAVGDQPTIVTLHEGLGSVSMWKNFPSKVANATGCSVLVYSRYGHGKSDALREPRRVDFMHHEGIVVLPALLKQLEIRRPILLGHSDGGSISLLYAAAAPVESPRALILEAPHVFVEDLTVQSIAKIGDVYRTTDLPAKLARHHDHPDEMFWGWNKIWLDSNFRGWNIEDCLDVIHCPILVIHGYQDEYGTMAQVAAIQRRIPRAETLALANCGHSPHRDQPTATLAAIAAFLRKLT
jgi:pimeloyl-ACP methyl ester carboxylesterase